MAERRSSHIRGRRAPGPTPKHAWRDRVLGCSLALTAVAAATEAAASDACPHAEFAPNPWFTCLDAEARPAAPASSPDDAVVVSDNGTVSVDAAGHVVGVFAEGPGGRVTTDGAGDVEIRTAGEGALGVALVGGPSVAGLGGQTVVAGPLGDSAAVWFEAPEAAGDRERLFVFGADGKLRLSPKAPVSEGAAVLGLGAVSTAEGVTTESVYFGPDADPEDEAGRSISVHGAQGVGVELSTSGADPAAGDWSRGAGSYGLEDFARSWDGGSNRHVLGATPPRGREVPPPAAEPRPQILIGGASADTGASRGAPSSAGADFAAAPSAAVAPEAYAALSVAGAAQTFWGQSADAWSARARTLRDRPGGEGVQAWVQAQGGAETLDRAAVKLEASWRGVQAGIDRRSTQGARTLWWGATVGFTDYDGDAGPDAFELRGANLGAYAGGQWGGFYAAALVKADAVDAEVVFAAPSRRSFDGVSWGARGEVGYRFGSARLFLEPSAALAWVEADLDGFADGGTRFDYDDATSLRGRTGVRLGGEATIGNAVLVPYVGVHAVAELDGENRMRVTDGGTFLLVDEGRGSWGEAEVGVSGATWFGLEAFAEAKAQSGGDVRGWSARLGARWRW